MINLAESDEITKEIEKLEEAKGDLVLLIGCTKCDAIFELNKEALAIALVTGESILGYINYIQQSKCRICEGKDKDLRNEEMNMEIGGSDE